MIFLPFFCLNLRIEEDQKNEYFLLIIEESYPYKIGGTHHSFKI